MNQHTSSQPVFVIAQQRSGTNLLRKSLAATPDFRDLDEVFHPEHKQYWHYRKAFLRRQPAKGIPTRNNQLAIFESFLENRLATAQSYTLIDVKYNSTHALNPICSSPIDVPLFIRWLIEKQHPVIHLTRANHLENYVSMAMGTESAKWIVGRDEDLPSRSLKLKLDPEVTLKQVQRRERELRRFRHYLRPANCVEFEYNDLLCPRGHFNDELLQSLALHLGLDQLPLLQPSTRKMGRSLSEVVVNLDTAIKPLLLQHGYDNLFCHLNSGPTDTADSISPHADTSGSPAAAQVCNVVQTTVRDRLPQPRTRVNPAWQPVFLIAMQQAETDDLRNALTSHSSLTDLNEVFHPKHRQFWPFRRQQISRNADLSLPTAANQLELFESFLDDHRKRNPAGVLIELKYSSLHHLNHVWHPPGSRPLLLDWLAKNRYPIIHLVQDNLLQTSVHEIVRRHCGLPHDHLAPATQPTLKLRPAEILRRIRSSKKQQSILRSWLESTHCLELQAEHLIRGEGSMAEEAAASIRQHLGIPGIRSSQLTQKTYPAVGAGIENFETEIRPALLKQGFAKWLPPARAA